MFNIIYINIQSFSYRSGFPVYTSNNKGKYIFDCRGILNPYSFGNLRLLIGKISKIQ